MQHARRTTAVESMYHAESRYHREVLLDEAARAHTIAHLPRTTCGERIADALIAIAAWLAPTRHAVTGDWPLVGRAFATIPRQDPADRPS